MESKSPQTVLKDPGVKAARSSREVPKAEAQASSRNSNPGILTYTAHQPTELRRPTIRTLQTTVFQLQTSGAYPIPPPDAETSWSTKVI
mgnify:CR=1 FL=1